MTIIITLPASEQATDQRQALVSVGVATQAPVSKSGVLGRLPDLLADAWKAFGVQAGQKAQKQKRPFLPTSRPCPPSIPSWPRPKP